VRDPRGGRSFEYYGEDPLLAGRLIAPQLRAIQRQGVIATVKHFVGNEQETDRERSNSVISERSLRELYLQPFEIAIRAGQPGMVRRKLRAMIAVGLLDGDVSADPISAAAANTLAQRVAEQGLVLLKNEADSLPLQAHQLRSIAVIGEHADVGVLSGGGSAQVAPAGGLAVPIPPPSGPPPYWPETWLPSSPLAAIRERAPKAAVRFDAGMDPAAAAALAARSDVAIVFVNAWRVEGQDLPNLSLPHGQNELVAQVAAANPRTIVVLQTGGPVLMPWIDAVPAVLEAWYPGIRAAEAIAAVPFGEVNPSGKLPVSFPASEADLPMGAAAPRACA
jgi:beta-glucosidase